MNFGGQKCVFPENFETTRPRIRKFFVQLYQIMDNPFKNISDSDRIITSRIDAIE